MEDLALRSEGETAVNAEIFSVMSSEIVSESSPEELSVILMVIEALALPWYGLGDVWLLCRIGINSVLEVPEVSEVKGKSNLTF